MAQVMTVNGPINADDLGVTMMHEHVYVDLWKEIQREGILENPATAVLELQPFKDLGGGTIVDVSNQDIGRNPLGLRSVSRDSGIHIVMATGHYRNPFLDTHWFDRNSVSDVARELIRDIEVGVADTGVRAGIIGEIGCERRWIGAAEERSFRAAAKAQVATGVPISTHAAGWPSGLDQLDLLESEGANPARIVIGHCDTVPDPNYHLAIAKRGAWVQFDTIREANELELSSRVRYFVELASAGYLSQILLSQDICVRSHLASRGGGGYSFLLREFVPRLVDAGVSESDVRTVLVDNPRRVLIPNT